MKLIDKIKSWMSARSDKYKLENWYTVRWDKERIYREVSPPGKDPWNDSLRWSDIERICFEATDLYDSDHIVVFTNQREESYLIPTEAKGGGELWNEIINRKRFDSKLACEAASAIGGMFCWPELEK